MKSPLAILLGPSHGEQIPPSSYDRRQVPDLDRSRLGFGNWSRWGRAASCRPAHQAAGHLRTLASPRARCRARKIRWTAI